MARKTNMVVLIPILVMANLDMVGPPTMVQAMILTDMADLCTALIIHHKGA